MDKQVRASPSWAGQRPAPGFTQGEAFALGYTCADDLTGVARCDGSEQGSAIDTSTLGTHEIAVQVADRVGNGALVLKQYDARPRPGRSVPAASRRSAARPGSASG